MRLPLVEDHEEPWDFLSRRVEGGGFDVAVATDGQESVDKSKRRRRTSFLLDTSVPVVDGWPAVGTIRLQSARAGHCGLARHRANSANRRSAAAIIR